MRRGRCDAARLAALMLACAAVVPPPARAQPSQPTDVEQRSLVLAAGNRRLAAAGDREVVSRALAAAAPDVCVLALRALARAQRPEFIEQAIGALGHRAIEVRREAAFAVAQMGSTVPAVFARAELALRDAVVREGDWQVRMSLAEQYGRLPFADGAAVAAAAAQLHTALALPVQPASRPVVAQGIARGAEALARRAARLQAQPPLLLTLLRTLLQISSDGTRPDAVGPMQVRTSRLAWAGLLALATPDAPAVDSALASPDAQVRRLAVLALARRATVAPHVGLSLLNDESLLVRHAVTSRLGARLPVVARTALADRHIHVRLAALHALGEAKACRDACVSPLVRDGAFAADWHEGAAALLALARTDPGAARAHVVRASRAGSWQVRVSAARAAVLTGQADVLTGAAADAHPNVRHAALVAWREAALPGLVGAAVDALGSDDGQLLLGAADALKGAPPSAGTVTAVRTALARLTALRRETSRDPRLALLERLDELDADRLRTLAAYLHDFDPEVAGRAAALYNARLPPGHAKVIAAARPLPGVAVPAWGAVEALERTTVILTLAGRRTLTLRLVARQAPTAVARFVAQVEAGDWDGRTFHRVEPGFVVQGGSPAANEYVGADTFSRDEFSALSHVRGTIGISTRGPDTGDGQIFVNLVDNVRLDYGFTLIGSFIGDVSAIDDIVEGTVIESARLVRRRTGPP